VARRPALERQWRLGHERLGHLQAGQSRPAGRLPFVDEDPGRVRQGDGGRHVDGVGRSDSYPTVFARRIMSRAVRMTATDGSMSLIAGVRPRGAIGSQ
jgi:hypothetical protein